MYTVIGTCIRDPWTKPKGVGSTVGGGGGWGGGKWWRENGDNSIRTSIKKVKNIVLESLGTHI